MLKKQNKATLSKAHCEIYMAGMWKKKAAAKIKDMYDFCYIWSVKFIANKLFLKHHWHVCFWPCCLSWFLICYFCIISPDASYSHNIYKVFKLSDQFWLILHFICFTFTFFFEKAPKSWTGREDTRLVVFARPFYLLPTHKRHGRQQPITLVSSYIAFHDWFDTGAVAPIVTDFRCHLPSESQSYAVIFRAAANRVWGRDKAGGLYPGRVSHFFLTAYNLSIREATFGT